MQSLLHEAGPRPSLSRSMRGYARPRRLRRNYRRRAARGRLRYPQAQDRKPSVAAGSFSMVSGPAALRLGPACGLRDGNRTGGVLAVRRASCSRGNSVPADAGAARTLTNFAVLVESRSFTESIVKPIV